MVSAAGGIIIAIVVLALVAAVAWIVFTQYRARRLGLPTPSLSSYLPWKKRDSPYGPPQPAPGGVAGWFNDQVRKFKNRNNRSAAGAYEPSNRGVGVGVGGARGAFDPDEAWDTRVGNEADHYGYYEEELTARGGGAVAAGAGRRISTEYHGGSSYNMNLAATPGRERDEDDVDLERGRQPSRSPGAGPRGNNPFDDDHAAESLRGVSPRPMEHGHKSSASPSRHSVFKENV
ncbi:hypothetical protein ISF_03394 [Cordyceps fumosorosea ARSEF 2679]|uniref:Acid phosphatase-like protein n=1 Tax=Cordyceps fumosorosea (strain ARSEF 2679) TaxID=1081104 RepID=A0A162MRD9_CORFA|nr:hypothetical protein ISF_03394 [Cordyceps fumosorosea ARSEF 2679]OAA69019.1 hypothetical protein ISF_03394 [Cordyceps fumosorosea ARSEF 2679]